MELNLEFYFLERGFTLRHSVTVSILRISVNYCAFTKEYVICDVCSRFQEVLTVKSCDWGNFGVLDRCQIAYLLIRQCSQATYLRGLLVISPRLLSHLFSSHLARFKCNIPRSISFKAKQARFKP